METIILSNNTLTFRINDIVSPAIATISIYGQNFLVESINGIFIWDISGEGRHVFETIGEVIYRAVGLNVFSITWLGYPDLMFKIDYGIIENHTRIFVSLDGNDSGDGSVLYPVKTLSKARDLAEGATSIDGIYITMMEGTYELSSLLVLSTDHSGSTDKPVVYEPLVDGTVILSGGKRIVGTWTRYSDDGIYYINTSETFRQLYVNGERAQRAKTEWFTQLKWEPLVPGTATNQPKSGRLIVSKSDIVSYTNLVGAEVRTKRKFMSDIMRIEAVEDDVNPLDANPALYIALKFESPERDIILTFGDSTLPHYLRVYNGAGYQIENSLEFLQNEGDWFLDASAGRLYYKPVAGTDINSTEFSIPNIEKIIEIEGDSIADQVHNIQFNNLIFEQTRWEKPSTEGYVQNQGGFVATSTTTYFNDVYFPPGGISLQNANNIKFDSCTIRNFGASGLNLIADCSDITIEHCLFDDISAIGIIATDFTDVHYPLKPVIDLTSIKNLTIYNNKILNTGVDYFCYAVSLNYLEDGSITHNTIAYSQFSTLAVGFRGYSGVAKRNDVSYNKIYDFSQELGESGGIYTLYPSVDSTMTNNYIYRMHSPNDAVSGWGLNFWGMMIDDASEGWTIENNLVDTTVSVEGETNPPNTSIETILIYPNNTYINNYTDPTGHDDIIANAGATW